MLSKAKYLLIKLKFEAKIKYAKLKLKLLNIQTSYKAIRWLDLVNSTLYGLFAGFSVTAFVIKLTGNDYYSWIAIIVTGMLAILFYAAHRKLNKLY